MAKKAAPAKAAKKPAAKKAAPAKAAASKSASKSASKTATTITLKHLAAELAPEHELSKKQAEGVLTGMIDLMVKNLKKGQRIRLVGLGILQVRKRAARMGRNPATGEAIKIKASKKVAFRAAKELKEAI
jgi:DNA-binding protein HU-beta